MTILLLTIIALLLSIIIILLRNRGRYKTTRQALESSRIDLEDNLEQHATELEQANIRLNEASARHKATNVLLRESREYITSIINSLPYTLIGVTPSGKITHWNHQAETETGLGEDQALGRDVASLYTGLPITHESIKDAIKFNTAHRFENVQIQSSTSQFFDVAIYPLQSDQLSGAVIRIEDVSMRVKMEHMMIQNEKMMSLGELAAGTAHEINNPLGGMLQNLQNIKRRLASDLAINIDTAKRIGIELGQLQTYIQERQINELINAIEDAGQQAITIVTNMLEFSRANNTQKQGEDVVDLIEHAISLLSSNLHKPSGLRFIDIPISRRYEPELPALYCTRVEIQQVIMNLLRNSFQALAAWSHQTHPVITIRAYSDNHYMRIDIEDNGPGIDEQTQRQIFQPFYTTKDVGEGTGLGLSVSYFIINEHHDGSIEVHSEPGSHTCFTISIPLFRPNLIHGY